MKNATAIAIGLGAVLGLLVAGKKVWDNTSAARISRLHPRIRGQARQLLINAERKGIKLRVVSGLRTYEEQAALYAQGRTAPGPVVTNARPGYSWHNFGLAFDVVPVDNGRENWGTTKWPEIGALGKALGLEWGGDWSGFVDRPHFQNTLGLTTAQARERVAAGQVDGNGFLV